MLLLLRKFLKSQRGYLLQVFMALLIIGGMSFYLLNENYKKPMEQQMSNFTTNLETWTDPAADE